MKKLLAMLLALVLAAALPCALSEDIPLDVAPEVEAELLPEALELVPDEAAEPLGEASLADLAGVEEEPEQEPDRDAAASDVPAAGNSYTDGNYDTQSFWVDEHGVLRHYYGPGGDIVIPDGIVAIGAEAFKDSDYVTSVVIPDSVTDIGESAFWNCEALRDIVIPDSVKGIGAKAFYWCPRLASATIGSGVTSIGAYAFCNCESLTSLTIGGGVTDIGESAFSYCTGLTTVAIPGGVTDIGAMAFSGCGALAGVTIGSGVKRVGESAFSGCAALTDVTLPDSVTAVGDSAFLECGALTRVTIGSGLTDLHFRAFSGCDRLKAFYVSGDNPEFAAVDGVLYTRDMSAVLLCPGARTSVTLPKGLKRVGEGAFENCHGLKRVTIPAGVTAIGPDAFAHCDSLAAVTLPKSLTRVEDFAFSGCAALTSVTIPTGVRAIGEHAFLDCAGLASVIVLPEAVDIDDEAFAEARPTFHTVPGSDAAKWASDHGFAVKEDVLPLSGSVTREAAKGDAWQIGLDGAAAKSYKSSDTSVATVTKAGYVKVVGRYGTAKITVTLTSGKKYALTLKVPDPAKLSRTKLSLKVGKSAKLKLSGLYGRTVAWTSSKPKVATVEAGKVTAVKAGKCAVTAKLSNGKTLKCVVTVTDPAKLSKTKLTLKAGKSAKLKVSGLNGRTVAAWTSSKPKVATVEDGKVTALKAGKCTVTAKLSNGKTLKCTVTVVK